VNVDAAFFLMETRHGQQARMALSWIVAWVVAGGGGADIAGGATPVRAEAAVDKSSYHLFHPTPWEFMRDFSTDRPDKTESAYSVDAGRFQVEADLFTYTRDHDTADGADTRVDAYSAGAINFKMGLCHRADLQLIFESFNYVRTEDRVAGVRSRQRGIGDLTTRLKVNLWGNEGGSTALAAMPWVKFPTNADGLGNNAVEAGLILPLAVELPGGWGMGAMTEFDMIQNAGNSDYHAEFVNSITFGHDIVGRLAGYVEFWSLVSTESEADWVGTVDLGLTYALTKNVQLDAGVNIGVTESADDFNPFAGISFRF
jgi:Putative MetA-pathway of phenol degradation